MSYFIKMKIRWELFYECNAEKRCRKKMQESGSAKVVMKKVKREGG